MCAPICLYKRKNVSSDDPLPPGFKLRQDTSFPCLPALPTLTLLASCLCSSWPVYPAQVINSPVRRQASSSVAPGASPCSRLQARGPTLPSSHASKTKGFWVALGRKRALSPNFSLPQQPSGKATPWLLSFPLGNKLLDCMC